jgi:hypothetical protein
MPPDKSASVVTDMGAPKRAAMEFLQMLLCSGHPDSRGVQRLRIGEAVREEAE